MMLEFTIKNARLDDLDEIFEIETASFSVPWTKHLLKVEILSGVAEFLVARDEDGLLLGYVSGQQILDEFYIGNIAVREDRRGLGVGSALLQQLIDIARDKGSSFATLEVRVSNTAARKMYENFGFVQVGERKDYYQLPTENAVLYTLYFNKPEA